MLFVFYIRSHHQQPLPRHLSPTTKKSNNSNISIRFSAYDHKQSSSFCRQATAICLSVNSDWARIGCQFVICTIARYVRYPYGLIIHVHKYANVYVHSPSQAFVVFLCFRTTKQKVCRLLFCLFIKQDVVVIVKSKQKQQLVYSVLISHLRI